MTGVRWELESKFFKCMRKLLLILLLLLFFTFPKPSFAQGILTGEKLITVDLAKQRLYAWENGKIKKRFRVSTGMYYTPTVKGSFTVYKKVDLQDMRGYFPPYKPYFIKNVPHVMYFHKSYAIHGTHWHSKFGERASHGCVNLGLWDAQWLYAWSPMGTRVEVF